MNTPEQNIVTTSAGTLETLTPLTAQQNLSLVTTTPVGTSSSCTIQELTPLSFKCQALIASTVRSKFFPLLKCLETVQQFPMNPNAIVETKSVCEKLQSLFPSDLEKRTKAFLEQHSQTIREWHKAHMESLSLEAKRTILVHE